MLPLMDFIGIVIAYSLILILGCIFIYFLTKRWMRPVRALGAVMLQVKAGELHARYEKDSMGLQINALGAIFNGMVDSLLSSQERAEKESAKRELFAQELQLGREAQKRLLTEPRQDFSPLEIAQLYIPASEVGGDFYDIFRKANGKLIFAIADASGKGVLACCFSLAARNILRTLANIHDDVGMVLWQGNNLFCEDTGESGMFVTVEIAQFDPESRLLSYHSLGHNPAIICRTDGTIEWLKSADMAMGVLVKAEPQRASQIKFEEGDVLVLYTDGVTEAHNPHSQLFGEERLKKVIQRERKEKASVILEQIEKEVKTFAAGRELFDDLTLIVVKYETPL